ncbi:MAG: hypothetical protein Q4B90_10865 [Eubacteriales bacterium]|nr:hypothetical protein [Eubacteriales bacterium]
MRKKSKNDMVDTSDINELDNADEASPEDIKRGKKRMILSLIFFLLSVILFIVGLKMNWNEKITVICCLILIFIGLKLFFNNISYALLDEGIQTEEKYKRQELKQFSFSSIHTLKKILIENNFLQQENGWLFKKKFSFFKDAISYYVKFCDSSNVEETVDWQVEHIDESKLKGKSFCFILFVGMDTVTKETKEAIKSYGISRIIDTVLDPYTNITFILVALDKTSGKGWYMDINQKHGISMYAYGCRFLQKMFPSK